MLIKLHEAYLLKQCKTTEYNVRKEYRLMRKIMFSWMSLGAGATNGCQLVVVVVKRETCFV